MQDETASSLPKLQDRWVTENHSAYSVYLEPEPMDETAGTTVVLDAVAGMGGRKGGKVFDLTLPDEEVVSEPSSRPATRTPKEADQPAATAKPVTPSSPQRKVAHAAVPPASPRRKETAATAPPPTEAELLEEMKAMAGTSTSTKRKTSAAQRRAQRKKESAKFALTTEQIAAREKKEKLQGLKRDSRWFSNTKFGRLFDKPPFAMYGNGNRDPTDGGIMNGGYMASHNVMPLMHPANPKAESAMETVRFTNEAAVLKFDPARFPSLGGGVHPGEEGDTPGPDNETLMATARMALEEEYGAAVAERAAKRAEERARAAREKEEAKKPVPTMVDDSKRRVSRRLGETQPTWAVRTKGEDDDEAGEEEEEAAPRRRSDDLGLHPFKGEDARKLGYTTGFVSDLIGVPCLSYNSDRLKGLLAWQVEDLEDETEEEEHDAAEGAEIPEPAKSKPERGPKPVAAPPSRKKEEAEASPPPRPFEPAPSWHRDPRVFKLLPPSWTQRIPSAGKPTVRSEPASAAFQMFA
jgi:hypothetical protein